MNIRRGLVVLMMLAACTAVFAFGSREMYQGEDPAKLTVELSADGRSVVAVPEGYEAGGNCLDGAPIIKRIPIEKEVDGVWLANIEYRVNADGSLVSIEEAKDAIISGVTAELDPELIDNISFPLIYGDTIVIPASVDAVFPEYLKLPGDYDILLSEGNETFEVIDGVLYDKTKDELVFIFDNTPRLSSSFREIPLVIPEGTRSIGKACIYSNPYIVMEHEAKPLQMMVLPDSLEYIDPEAFMNGKPVCIMVEDNDNLNIKGNLLFSDDGRTLISVISPNDDILTFSSFYYEDEDSIPMLIRHKGLDVMVNDIPEGTEVIGPFALSGIQSGFGSAIIPSSVRKIGDYAFWNARFYSILVIPDSVEEVGEGGFWGLIAHRMILDEDTYVPFDALRYSVFEDI